MTVNVAADANHTAPSAKTCSVKVEMPNIYGVEWDGTSTTVWSRTDKAGRLHEPCALCGRTEQVRKPVR